MFKNWVKRVKRGIPVGSEKGRVSTSQFVCMFFKYDVKVFVVKYSHIIFFIGRDEYCYANIVL